MSDIRGLFNAVVTAVPDDGGRRLLSHCPGCKWVHGPAIGPGPGARWTFNDDYVKPVFHPSLLVTWTQHDRKNPDVVTQHTCHSFIGHSGAQPGQIIFLSDCTHPLAGQVVDIPQWVTWDDLDDELAGQMDERKAVKIAPRAMTADQLRRKRKLLAVKIRERRG